MPDYIGMIKDKIKADYSLDKVFAYEHQWTILNLAIWQQDLIGQLRLRSQTLLRGT